MSDLPDYTRQITVNVTVPPAQSYFYGKAETATKKVAKGEVAAVGDVCTITPSSGNKVVILAVFGTGGTAGDSLTLQTLQSAAWADVLPQCYVIANGHFFFTFPCWKPDQDTGNGTDPTVKLICEGTGPWRGFIMYYEEEA